MTCDICQREVPPGVPCVCRQQAGREFEVHTYSKHIRTVHIETTLPVYQPGTSTSAPDAWDAVLARKAEELGVEKP